MDNNKQRHLVDGEVRVGGNDGACRVVDTFAQDVPTDTAPFALEALRDGQDGPPRLLFVVVSGGCWELNARE